MTLSIRTDRQLIRSEARSNRYVLVKFTAPAAPRRETRQPVNVAFVLDRSGSMSAENKLHLARHAVETALGMLTPEDRFSIIVYDERVDVISRSSHATPVAIRHAIDALTTVHPRGSTDLFSGWMHGCNEVAEFADREQVSRVLLLTDGLANHGISDRGQLAHHAAELRQRGVTTSTFGVGEDFDERLLQAMAQEGGGNFYFLERAEQITDLLTSELGEALEVVIPAAAIEVEIPRHANAELLSRYRSSVLDNILRIELGDVVSSQEVELIVRMKLPRGDEGTRVSIRASLLTGGTVSATSNEIEWTYASHHANDSQTRNREVDRLVAAIYAARARADATEANRAGDLNRARHVMMRTAERIRRYAGDDRELRRIWQTLEAERPRYDEAMMSPMMVKQSYYQADMAIKGRAIDGKARRAPR